MSFIRHTCDNCGRTNGSSTEVARAFGWRLWEGVTVGGKHSKVNLCSACVGHKSDSDDADPGFGVECRACGWVWEDEHEEGPLSEKDARQMACDHECEPDTRVYQRLASIQQRVARR